MTIHKCDACGKIMESYHSISFPVHISDESVKAKAYVDSEGQQCSGRFDEFEFCTRCYNSLWTVMFLQFQSMKSSREPVK